MRALLFAAGCLMMAVQAFAHTVKTEEMDVNLWSKAGRAQASKIGRIKQWEEVRVIGTRKLPNGETWYKVALGRTPDWRLEDQTGWVDSKFFSEVSQPSVHDPKIQTEAGSRATCKGCSLPNVNKQLDEKTAGLTDIAKTLRKMHAKSKSGSAVSSKGFIWPVTGIVRSGFGWRVHPVFGTKRMHNGLDIGGGNNGRTVKAAKRGRVIVSRTGCRTGNKSCGGGAGNNVVIDHGDGTVTKYMHLNPACPLPRTGSTVSQGERIGCVGSTGASTGPHLHFAVIVRGHYVNPVGVLPKR